MKTWQQITEAKRQYLLAIGPGFPDWFRGVGIGFQDLSYVLAILVREEKDVEAAKDVATRMGYNGPLDIQAVGDIVAL